MKRLNKKGFTLAELLIVVAIIAVLVAIAMPVFNSQLENAREATDAANIRSAYADAMTKYLTASETDQKSGVTSDMTFAIKARTAAWANTSLDWSYWGTAAPTVEVGKTYKVKITGDATDLNKFTPSLDKQGT